MMTTSPCPVCQFAGTTPFLRRAGMPVHQNLLLASRNLARSTVRGDLELAVCERCGFVFNLAFDLAKLGYGEAYDNTQTCSPFFQSYVDGLVQHLGESRGVRHQRIVEVGCGKGRFLRQLVGGAETGNTGLGFDPSYQGPTEDLGGRLRFERSYFGSHHTKVEADVVICRHVIEHVPDPVALLRDIRLAVASRPEVRLYFETPCVEWILTEQVVWDFFYEHCSYFTAGSLSTAFERAGFAVDEVRHVFGGQYLWLEARLGEFDPTLLPDPGDIFGLATNWTANEQALVERARSGVERARAQGPVGVWGAGAKGVTLVNLIDPDASTIVCVVDLNPNKQGRFVPGTGHAIVAPDKLRELGVVTICLMNPNYRHEVLATLAELGLDTITVVDL
jgi:SAM-dependent methyltransferase